MYKEDESVIVDDVAEIHSFVVGISRLGSRWVVSPTPIAFQLFSITTVGMGVAEDKQLA